MRMPPPATELERINDLNELRKILLKSKQCGLEESFRKCSQPRASTATRSSIPLRPHQRFKNGFSLCNSFGRTFGKNARLNERVEARTSQVDLLPFGFLANDQRRF